MSDAGVFVPEDDFICSQIWDTYLQRCTCCRTVVADLRC